MSLWYCNMLLVLSKVKWEILISTLKLAFETERFKTILENVFFLISSKYLTDVNECEEGTHSCHDNATCTNTIGSYSCSCVDGFSGDGKQCRGTNTSLWGLSSVEVCENSFVSFALFACWKIKLSFNWPRPLPWSSQWKLNTWKGLNSISDPLIQTRSGDLWPCSAQDLRDFLFHRVGQQNSRTK